MSTSTVGIWSNSQIVNATSNLTYKQTGVDTPSVKYTNASIYPLEIANTNYGVPIDVLPPMCAVISSNPINFTLTLDVSVGSNIPAEALTQSVSVTYIDAKVPYQIIPLSNLNVGSITNVSGNVDVSGSEIAVTSMPVTNVQFEEAQDVNLSASDITLDTQIANVVLSENPGYEVVTNQQWALEFAAAGDTMNQNITMPGGVSLFDMIYVSVFSPSGYLDDYTVSFVPFWFMGQPDTLFYSSIDGVVLPGQSSNTGVYALDLSSVVASGVPFNGISLTITSSAAVSETIVFSIFGRYASADIRNPSTSPVNAVAPPNDMQDASGSIAEGGTAQTVLESNANRRFLSIVNPGNANGDTLWVNFGSDASAGAGSYPLGPGIGLFFPQGQFVPSSSVNLYAATTGDTFTVKYA